MARIRNSDRNVLNVRKVQSLSKPGLYADGGGLYLQIGKEGGKSWSFRFHLGRSRQMGLGSLADASLAEARRLAEVYRAQLSQGVDPLGERHQKRAAARLAATRVLTFRECAETYIAAQKPSWRNEKHTNQWVSTLVSYAYPVMAKLQVSDIETDHVLKVLEPIWIEKHETAKRVRGRIERILDWAAVMKYRGRENPARWVGHLKELLPKRPTTATEKPHPALPYEELRTFMEDLRKQKGTTARALELAILTAVRTSELLKATWGEFDLDRREWTIPAERMKNLKPHRVPLSDGAMSVLTSVARAKDSTLVFPSRNPEDELSTMAMLQLLRRMHAASIKAGGSGYMDPVLKRRITTHGFRSTFRGWAAEQSNHPNHVVEMALAHTISDKVERAYQRMDLIEKRRQLMQEYSNYAS